MNLIVKLIPPHSYNPSPTPDKNDKPGYGKYLVTIAGCSDCHTPMEKGKRLPGMDFAGGFEFKLPMGTIRSANITPDPDLGIGKWTKEDFIKRFKSMESDSSKNIVVREGEFNTVMPWTMFAGMEVEDLGAIYEYLRTLTPVSHIVVRFTPAK